MTFPDFSLPCQVYQNNCIQLNVKVDMASRLESFETVYDPSARIWIGAKVPSTYGPECSLGQVLLDKLLEVPDQIAQICFQNGKQYTNREIAELTIRVAAHFKKLGMQQCEVVGFCAGNSDFVAPLVFGALLNGLIISTLDPTFEKSGIKHIFSQTKPSIMFCDGSVYERVKSSFEEMNSKIPIYTMTDQISHVPDISEFLQPTEDGFKSEPLKLGYLQTAMILCSSGTTGLPKGVCLSHAGLMNTGLQKFFKPEDRLICFSTLYWASGLLTLCGGTMSCSTRIISRNPFSPLDFFEIVDKYKANVIFSPPSQMALSIASPKIREYDLSSLSAYLCGGSAVSPALIAKMQTFLPNTDFIVGYGMTEVPCTSISSGMATPNGSTGQISSNLEVKIIDDDGKNLGPDETGEIIVRGIFPFSGYYANPEASAEFCDKDGWLHTGDIGYINSEGAVFIVDRKKDILKYNNYHFSPTEIENIIINMPDVSEVCVCGIPDVVSSFLPTAMIVKTPGATITENDIYQYVADRTDNFKCLRGGVYFVKEIPKTASGKYLRRKVTELCIDLKKR